MFLKQMTLLLGLCPLETITHIRQQHYLYLQNIGDNLYIHKMKYFMAMKRI